MLFISIPFHFSNCKGTKIPARIDRLLRKNAYIFLCTINWNTIWNERLVLINTSLYSNKHLDHHQRWYQYRHRYSLLHPEHKNLHIVRTLGVHIRNRHHLRYLEWDLELLLSHRENRYTLAIQCTNLPIFSHYVVISSFCYVIILSCVDNISAYGNITHYPILYKFDINVLVV